MTGNPPDHGATALRVSTLSKTHDTAFELRPDKDTLAATASQLGIDDLRKLSFVGKIRTAGKEDWLLTGHLGATVVQPCSVTLKPVTTRIEEDVTRRYTPNLPDDVMTDEEVEMPEDDTLEMLGSVIDPAVVMQEALALALPAYPRAEGVGPGDTVHTRPGSKAMTDEDTKPFAGLAGLMAKKTPEDGEDES